MGVARISAGVLALGIMIYPGSSVRVLFTRIAVLRLRAALIAALAGAAILMAPGGCGKQAPPKGRVFVLGLDGATFDLIRPWIDQGYLPVIKSLMDTGAYGTLNSVLPPMSPPAWTSAITGVNPGKHAIFDWYRRLPNSRSLVSETAKSRRAKAIWQIASDAGRKVGVINVPLTDPPDVVNGFMISGMPHTDLASYTYPEKLKSELDGYMIDSMGDHLDNHNAKELLAKFMNTYEERLKATVKLMTERDWDLFWVVFTATDRIQHYYWKFMDENHPKYEPDAPPELKNAIFNLWLDIDRGIGEILDNLPKDATLVVISDHGFGPIYKEVRFNNLIRGRDLDGEPICYTDGGIAQLIYLDMQGKLPYGIVPQDQYDQVRDMVAKKLLDLRDPETGERVVKDVHRKEDIYTGRYVSKAPDLVAIEMPFYYMQGDTIPGLDPVGPVTTTFSAFHQPNGIIIVRGEGIKVGPLDRDHNLIDVTPTLLYMLGEPVPRFMDGRVMEDLFEAGRLASAPVRYSEVSTESEEEKETEYTKEELEKLKAVPYLR
jgi:predicted AlkP superfamily phosphohydrolase/phosphomutase